MIAIPKSHAIKKSLGVVIIELHSPVPAAIGGFINTRLFARTRRKQVGEIRAECLDVAKVKDVSAWNICRIPGFSSIDGAHISAVSSTGPDDLCGGNTQSSQVLSGVRDLEDGLLRQAIATGKKQKTN